MNDDRLDVETFDLFEDVWWIFYLLEPSGSETSQPLIESLAAGGVRVVKEGVSDPHYEFVFYDPQYKIYFELSNGDDASEYVSLGIHAQALFPPEGRDSLERAQRFLELGKLCYQALRPLYAITANFNTYADLDSIRRHTLVHMYWAQIFGPQFVAGFGRDVLFNAPAWRKEELDDGGLLYVLAASPFLYRGRRQYWDRAGDYFRRHVREPIEWDDQGD